MQSAPCAPGQAPGFYVCVYSATSCKLVLLTLVQMGRDAVDLLLAMCGQNTQRYTGALSYPSIIVCKRLPYFNPVLKSTICKYWSQETGKEIHLEEGEDQLRIIASLDSFS